MQTLGYAQPNMRFVEGQIERLDEAGIADSSVDLIISNCVVRPPVLPRGGHTPLAPARAPACTRVHARMATDSCGRAGMQVVPLPCSAGALMPEGRALPTAPRQGRSGVSLTQHAWPLPFLPPPPQINLSPDKARVLREAWRVLAPGGEMFFSDVYCDRRLPQEASFGPRTHAASSCYEQQLAVRRRCAALAGSALREGEQGRADVLNCRPCRPKVLPECPQPVPHLPSTPAASPPAGAHPPGAARRVPGRRAVYRRLHPPVPPGGQRLHAALSTALCTPLGPAGALPPNEAVPHWSPPCHGSVLP